MTMKSVEPPEDPKAERSWVHRQLLELRKELQSEREERSKLEERVKQLEEDSGGIHAVLDMKDDGRFSFDLQDIEPDYV